MKGYTAFASFTLLLFWSCTASEQVEIQACLPGQTAVTYNDFGTRLLPRQAWSFGHRDGQELGTITDVALDSTGNVYVADPVQGVVHRLVKGTRINTFGRRGEGPGEFLAPVNVSAGSDTVYVFDTSLWRLSAFDSTGSFLLSFDVERLPDFGQVPEVDVVGNTVYNLSYPAESARRLIAARGDKRPQRVPTAVVRWRADDRAWRDIVDDIPSTEVLVRDGIQSAPFGNRPLWGVGHSRAVLWYSDTEKFSLRRVSLVDGSECAVSGVGFPDTRMTSEDREAFYNAEDVNTDDADRLRAIRDSRRDVALPNSRPLLRSQFVSTDGTVFLSLTTEPEGQYLVLSSDGEPMGRIGLPANAKIHEYQHPLLVTAVPDSLGVQAVVAWYLEDG